MILPMKRKRSSNSHLDWYHTSWQVPPKLTLSTWADRERILSSESNPTGGRWRTDRVPYLKEIMDTISDDEHEVVVFMAPSQAGKTETINNFVGYIIDQDPGPILLIQEDLINAKAWSKDRLDPMLRDTPCLRGKIGTARGIAAHDAVTSNEILHKSFAGGHLTVVGSNRGAGLSMRPIRYVIGDEIDAWAPGAGEEGDQLSLAEKRTTWFFNRKLIWISSPRLKATSRIEPLYEASDQRALFVPCPHCAHYQTLEWANFRWDKAEDGSHLPETAHFQCTACTGRIEEQHRPAILAACQWRARFPGRPIAGFWLWAAYCPPVPWATIASEFLRDHKNPEKFKVFVNTRLAETWEEPGDAPAWELLQHRAEPRQQWIVPDGVYFLTCGVDVQHDRLEASVYGWGADEECWLIGHAILYGEPEKKRVWDELDKHLVTPWLQPGQQVTLTILSTAIDSGYATQEVYAYCRSRMLVHATKGLGGSKAPPLGRPSFVDVTHLGQTVKKGLRLWSLEPGPRYIHFPFGLDDEFYKQMTAEKQVTRYEDGYPVQDWKKVRERNEALDCAIGAYAAALIAGIERIPWETVKQQTQPPASSHAVPSGQPGQSPDPRAVVTFGPPNVGRTRQMRSSGQGMMGELLRR
jgi:phage terminase large subunit GpA-like protein